MRCDTCGREAPDSLGACTGCGGAVQLSLLEAPARRRRRRPAPRLDEIFGEPSQCARCGGTVYAGDIACRRCRKRFVPDMRRERKAAPAVVITEVRWPSPQTRLCVYCRARGEVAISPYGNNDICPGCSIWMHDECWVANRHKCPTYGCHERWRRDLEARYRPFPQRTERPPEPEPVTRPPAPAAPQPSPPAPEPSGSGLGPLILGLLFVGIPLGFLMGLFDGWLALGAAVTWLVALLVIRES